MSATTKFYLGFFVTLLVVVVLSFYAGYRAGLGAHRAVPPHVTTHATRS